MILKKQGLVSVYSGVQCCLSPSYSTSTSPTVLPIPRARPDAYERRNRTSHTRTYATVKDSKTYDFRDNMNWPCSRSPAKKVTNSPTPYEIFDIPKTEVYSKHKFYELVKVYHPDRQSAHHHDPESTIHAVPPVERLERYRLIVQAHTILSDPVRRKAYDATGAGWGERSSWMRRDGSSRPHTATEPDSPFANATWEDWERWYARTGSYPHPGYNKHGSGPQTYAGTYISPNAFASFVIVLAVISGVLQATQAGQYTGSIEERAQAFTAKTAEFMSDRKVANSEYSTGGFSGHGFTGSSGGSSVSNRPVEHRIRHFLERRDPERYGLKDEEEETYRRHFAGQQDGLPPVKGLVRQKAAEERKEQQVDDRM